MANIRAQFRGETAQLLTALAQSRGLDVEDVLRRAIGHEALIHETASAGGSVILRSRDGRQRVLVLDEAFHVGETQIEIRLPDASLR